MRDGKHRTSLGFINKNMWGYGSVRFFLFFFFLLSSLRPLPYGRSPLVLLSIFSAYHSSFPLFLPAASSLDSFYPEKGSTQSLARNEPEPRGGQERKESVWKHTPVKITRFLNCLVPCCFKSLMIPKCYYLISKSLRIGIIIQHLRNAGTEQQPRIQSDVILWNDFLQDGINKLLRKSFLWLRETRGNL